MNSADKLRKINSEKGEEEGFPETQSHIHLNGKTTDNTSSQMEGHSDFLLRSKELEINTFLISSGSDKLRSSEASKEGVDHSNPFDISDSEISDGV